MKSYSKKQIRRILKNEYIFLKKLVQHNLMQLFELMSLELFSRELIWFTNQDRYAEFANRVVDRDRVLLKSLGEITQWPNDKLGQFLALIDNDLLPRFGFGPEWRDAFITAIATGVPIVPDRNLFIKTTGVQGKQSVVLILSPTASVDDIKEAWPEIKRRQKELWPDFEKINLNKKSYPRLRDFVQFKVAKKNRSNLSMGERYPNLSDYDLRMLPIDGIKKIKKYRIERGVRTKIIIRNRKKNTDIVKDLLGIKNKNALKRKVESLKKAGQRMAKKEGQLSN